MEKCSAVLVEENPGCFVLVGLQGCHLFFLIFVGGLYIQNMFFDVLVFIRMTSQPIKRVCVCVFFFVDFPTGWGGIHYIILVGLSTIGFTPARGPEIRQRGNPEVF